ncbi:MAG: glycoside hydrolase family 28 protein [Melioribacteraceae bacterium]|nr:glycoside hydrolase family 28 protein [Melioribacteraceae bacterium]
MKVKKLILFLTLISITFTFSQNTKNDLSFLFKDLPFKMKTLTVPKFPNKEFSIVKFGAVGDGQTLNTKAINDAIEACSKSGGGKVIVPAGMWLTGPIFMKDNVNLYLEKGAHIQFTKNFNDYPLIESNWEGYNQFRATSPIMGKNLNNIAITGYGIIDGAGEVWRPVKKSKLTASEWKALINSGGVLDSKGETWWPSKEALEANELMPRLRKENKQLTIQEAEKYKLFFRPVLLSFIECKNIWLDGVTFQNSPAWNLHPLLCENVILTNVIVRNPWYSQNGDGIDLESCKNSIIYNCKFDVGDDAICMKSGRDEEGRKRGRPTENVIIKDCIVYHGHGGFTIGSEMSGGVRNIKVDNCNFIGTDIGIRFKSNRERGGIVENIWLSNIYMKDIPTDALSFNMFYGGFAPTDDSPADEKSKSAKAIPVSESTPIFRNIFMNNIYCDGAKDAIILQGLPEMPIANIELKNVNMKADRGISIFDATNIKFENVTIASKEPIVKIIQSEKIFFNNLEPKGNFNTIMKINGEKSKDIFVKGKNALMIKDKTILSNEVNKDLIKYEN